MTALSRCSSHDCSCEGLGRLIWVADYRRWTRQLLCNRGGLIFLEIKGDLEAYDYVGDNPALKGNPAKDTPSTPTADDYLRCTRCNRLVLKSGKHHKYCAVCSRAIRAAKKREWIRKKRKELKESK